MSRWFVHIDEPYYPSGHVVEAATPADAISAAWESKHEGYSDRTEDRIAFAVVPYAEVLFSGKDSQITLLVDDLDEDEARYAETTTIVRAIPTPEGILPTPAEVAAGSERSKFFAMATYAVIAMPQHPTGWNPDPLGEHNHLGHELGCSCDECKPSEDA